MTVTATCRPRAPRAPTVCGSPQTLVTPSPGTGVTGKAWHQTELSHEQALPWHAAGCRMGPHLSTKLMQNSSKCDSK